MHDCIICGGVCYCDEEDVHHENVDDCDGCGHCPQDEDDLDYYESLPDDEDANAD